MIVLQTDYQTGTPDGALFILRYKGRPIEDQIDELGICSGTRVILDDEDSTATVEATLVFEFHPFFNDERWLARPDWSTEALKN